MSEDMIKSALQRMPYGFYAITSKNEKEANIMVANWVTQASFTPRLIAICLAKSAYSYKLIESGRVFAVNIFNKEDQEGIMPFTGGRAKRPNKMDDARYTPGPETGCPILDDAAAYIECKVIEIVDVGGDHVILVGEAINGDSMKDGGVTDTLTLPDLGWSYAG